MYQQAQVVLSRNMAISEEKHRELVQKRGFKGFGILLFTELRVTSGSLEFHVVETHRTILNQKGKYFSLVVAG